MIVIAIRALVTITGSTVHHGMKPLLATVYVASNNQLMKSDVATDDSGGQLQLLGHYMSYRELVDCTLLAHACP